MYDMVFHMKTMLNIDDTVMAELKPKPHVKTAQCPSGCDDFETKPIEFDRLIATIRRILAVRKDAGTNV